MSHDIVLVILLADADTPLGKLARAEIGCLLVDHEVVVVVVVAMGEAAVALVVPMAQCLCNGAAAAGKCPYMQKLAKESCKAHSFNKAEVQKFQKLVLCHNIEPKVWRGSTRCML